MTNSITETLLFPYRKGLIENPAAGSHLLFLNAEDPRIIPDGVRTAIVQPRYDLALPLRAGYEVLPDFSPQKVFDTIWILPRKDKQEMQYLLGTAAASIKDNGIIAAAAPNDAGGKRLDGLFEMLGLQPQAESKNKARAVFATAQNVNQTQAEQWISQGQEQAVIDGKILSRPGLHGWDKIDEGSALLAQHLPSLTGNIADFGCGWGYLSLQAASHAKHLTMIDIDARAISLAERNVKNKFPSLPVKTIWTDLTHPDQNLGPFDAILLNPPFHDGTHANPALGQQIIITAAHALVKTGTLYLVANKHLPYEKTLHSLFANVNLLAEEQGFKAFACHP